MNTDTDENLFQDLYTELYKELYKEFDYIESNKYLSNISIKCNEVQNTVWNTLEIEEDIYIESNISSSISNNNNNNNNNNNLKNFKTITKRRSIDLSQRKRSYTI